MRRLREEIIAAVKAAGVVGAGGAGFPTHVKINASVDTVIVNGAECEPLLRAHQLIMASESAKLIAGLKTVMAATGARQGVIGLKHKYEDAAAKLQAELKNEQAIELFSCLTFIPPVTSRFSFMRSQAELYRKAASRFMSAWLSPMSKR